MNEEIDPCKCGHSFLIHTPTCEKALCTCMKFTEEHARYDLCPCGHPQSFPVPHRHDWSKREETIFQAGKSSTIAKIREGMPKKEESDKFIWQVLYDIEEKRVTRFKGREKILKYYSDLIEKNINDFENEVPTEKKISE